MLLYFVRMNMKKFYYHFLFVRAHNLLASLVVTVVKDEHCRSEKSFNVNNDEFVNKQKLTKTNEC